jgi:malonyl-CoA/methylmalonyl-CoA synthetase
MNDNLYQLFASRFPKDASRPFLETDNGAITSYSDLECETARYARFLTELGLAKGDRVAVKVEKSPQALLLYLACVRAGLIYLPLNTAYQEEEINYFLGNAEPKAIVCRPRDQTLVERLAGSSGTRHVFTLDENGEGTLARACARTPPEFETRFCGPDDVAAIVYTSGTTGRSKGAMLTHRNLASNALTLVDYWGFRETDVLLHALPIFHVHGLFVACHCVLLTGSRMVFLRKFDAGTVLQYLPKGTVMMGVPTYYARLLEDPRLSAEACRSMRLFISGSAPLLEETFQAFEQRTGHRILERYGMSETAMLTSNPLHGERIAGTVGFPLPGVSARIVDDNDMPLPADAVGHVQVKGPNVFRGYWRMPDKTKEEFTSDGFFRTGDMGRFAENGYLCIVGRSKDLVISGGYNVYPKEVELIIDRIAGVKESAVIGVPHKDFGEALIAVVVRDPAGLDVTEDAVLQTVKASLANYKVPKKLVFVDELPRNAMGKVQKNVLRERFGAL